MDHVRIDEGFKRGQQLPQRAPDNQRNGLGQYMPKASQEAIKQAVEAFRDGQLLATIAEQHGVSIQAIYSWLLAELGGDQYQKLVTETLATRIAIADYKLDVAPNPLELARAREQCRNARMDMERRRPQLYGQKQEVTHHGNPGPVIAITLAIQPEIAHQTGDVAVQTHEPVTIEHPPTT